MAGDPAILFVKPKAISVRDKKALQAAGVIVVEVENVADVKLTRANAELLGGDLLLAAGEAIKSSSVSRDAFAHAVCAAIEARCGKTSP